jgi:hypothetical protein
MTRCLDIIQDYLAGKSYGFERIDGAVRGDLRQASIDRFCNPQSINHIFLLSTRAGGIGINLTVADTVILFDSGKLTPFLIFLTDWNPQNDLQAQARCHRIGQKKPVLIYRLITRNTYERFMFDKASIKLGLDKALLQRMDGGVGSDADPYALSSDEIEKFLKMGAYAALLDDDSAASFCEEDIDDILLRRTQTIRHDSSKEKSSSFSKASFASVNSNSLDMNDPGMVYKFTYPRLLGQGCREGGAEYN